MAQLADTSLAIGAIFQGGYEILSELGAGSFGRVYRARQLSTGQEVAIKILRLRLAETAAEVRSGTERFRREMRLCVELSHPNIVRLIDSGESADGVLYAVFQYVPGVTLKELLAKEGKLPVAEAVHLMTQVLDALSCAHARGIVHRDLKPENIMISKTSARRNALVLDFGLGGFARESEARGMPRITMSHEMMGTPCYAAPEQLRGESPSTRSDLYSWGLIFLECLTGELAVPGASAQEVILTQVGPEPIQIPTWLHSHGLGRLLAAVTVKQLEKRSVTVEELLQTLGKNQTGWGARAHEPIAGQAAGEGERRQVTLVCCRLSLRRADDRTLDPEEIDHLLHAQYSLLGSAAARNDGHLAGVMVDRCFLVFGYPHAREDDARRAVRTALAIVDEVAGSGARLRPKGDLVVEVQIGVHTGLIIVRDLQRAQRGELGEIVGFTPRLAEEVQAHAGPGEVWVSEDTHRLLRGDFTGEAAGAMRLPELSGAMALFRLGRARGVTGTETLTSVQETPLVGRDRQLADLADLWARAGKGRSAAVLIQGEPGLGKSRLLRELRRRVPADAWLECRCVAENQSSPLRPFVELVGASEEPIDSVLQRYGFELPETVPLFTALLSLAPDERYPPLALSRERLKELTLTALVTLLVRMAVNGPLVLALEDLQWADPTTIELVSLLVQEVRTTQMVESTAKGGLYLVFTARPEFSPPWSSEDVSMIQLARLTEPQVVEMIGASLSGTGARSEAVIDEIVRRTDGVPLFVEEMARVFADPGMAERIRDAPFTDLASDIPTSLRNLLAGRLDRLSSGGRSTAQFAAILGREFRYEVLQAVSGRRELDLREELRELIAAGLVFQRRSVRSETYVFKHALVRDTAYESMLRAVRRQLHRRVALTLRERFPEIDQHRPDILAQHFEAGGEIESAVAYWHRAGDSAFKRAAYLEAVGQLEHAEALLKTVAESPQRDRQEVALLTTLGTVFFTVKGHAAEEVERTFIRARELCQRLGEDLSIKLLTGIISAYMARNDRETVDQLLPHFRRLADRTEDAVSAITGHAVLGGTAFWSGDFAAARHHMAIARRYYGTEDFKLFAEGYGYDGGFFVFPYTISTLWNLGYPDQAAALREEMESLADQSGNMYSMLLSLGFVATLAHNRGEAERELEVGERLIVLASEQRLYFWMAIGMLARGGALSLLGRTEEAVAQVGQGLDLCRMTVLSSYSYYLTYLASALLQAKKAAEGLAAAEEGLALCRTGLTRFHESELFRLKADLLALEGDVAAAEESCRQALDVARRQGAKSLELRAAMVMCRLLRSTGRKEEGRAFLEGVYGWFTEGFDTRDLRAARVLLAEL